MVHAAVELLVDWLKSFGKAMLWNCKSPPFPFPFPPTDTDQVVKGCTLFIYLSIYLSIKPSSAQHKRSTPAAPSQIARGPATRPLDPRGAGQNPAGASR